MIIFLEIMAALFGLSALTEISNDNRRKTYAFCFAASVVGIVAYKLICTML